MREKFSEANYRAFMCAREGYCLREYIDHPEPHLTLDFIKGLHRQFYSNAPSVLVKAVDGSMTTMVPGEFKAVPVFARQGDGWAETPPSESVPGNMAGLLDNLTPSPSEWQVTGALPTDPKSSLKVGSGRKVAVPHALHDDHCTRTPSQKSRGLTAPSPRSQTPTNLIRCSQTAAPLSLDRHTLGQVARFIHIRPLHQGRVVGQQL